MDTIEINGWSKDAGLAALVRATFPEYRRRKIWVRAAETVTFYDLNWSGGTRAEYKAVTLAGEPVGSMARYNAMAPWDSQQAEGKTVPLPAGMVVARGGHFCGKEAVLTLLVNPADMPRYLPAPQVRP